MYEAYYKIKRTIQDLDFDSIFIFDDINDKQYTYDEYFKKCLQIAHFLDKTNRNKPIVAIMENSIELSMLYFAAMLVNVTIMAVDPQKGPEELKSILDELTEIRIICENDIDYIKDNFENFIDFELCVDDDVCINDVKKSVLEKISERDFSMPYLVTFTSGTSGKTKGVMHSLNSLFQSAYALHEKIDTRLKSCLLHVMPMTYMAGILNSLIYPFVAGASIVLTRRFSVITARLFWKKAIKYNANLFWLSPAMLMMIEQMDRGEEGKRYCKENELCFLIGTSALTNKTRETFNKKYGVTVQASYGLTETLFVSVETQTSLSEKYLNSVGEFLDGVEYRLSDTAELLIYVPWMYLGYTNENTQEYFDEQYYKSGDQADVNGGQLFIIGRCKDIIVKGGMNISAALIESCILENTDIVDCAVIGVKDRMDEEKICCVYVLPQKQSQSAVSEAEVKKMVLNKLGKNYFIDYFCETDKLPRNQNGKIDKNRMINIWESENG